MFTLSQFRKFILKSFVVKAGLFSVDNLHRKVLMKSSVNSLVNSISKLPRMFIDIAKYSVLSVIIFANQFNKDRFDK